MIDNSSIRAAQVSKSAAPVVKTKTFHGAVADTPKSKAVDCVRCSENHFLYQCKQFIQMTPKERQEFVQNTHLCFNCLSPTHRVLKCRQSMGCRRCGRRHHTMLHFERESRLEQPPPSAAPASSQNPESAMTSRADTNITTTFSRQAMQANSVLLATAEVKVSNVSGCRQTVRVLLDQGSQASFITEATAKFLGLERQPVRGWVSGLGDGRTRVKHAVSIRCKSRHNPDSSVLVNAYILPSLTSLLPATQLQPTEWREIESLSLADPTYTTPGKIDMLLGAEVYAEVLVDGMKKHPEGNLMAQNTIFGWILSGKFARENENESSESKESLVSMHVQMNEDDSLKRFWEIEDEPDLIQKEISTIERERENLFDKNTIRDHEGRFVVKLPFTTEDPQCQYGNSEYRAIKRLESLERKLSRDIKMRESYNEVIKEYLSMDHMRPITEDEAENPKAV